MQLSTEDLEASLAAKPAEVRRAEGATPEARSSTAASRATARADHAASSTEPADRARPGRSWAPRPRPGVQVLRCRLRQSQIFAREGIDHDRSTLADWMAVRVLYSSP